MQYEQVPLQMFSKFYKNFLLQLFYKVRKKGFGRKFCFVGRISKFLKFIFLTWGSFNNHVDRKRGKGVSQISTTVHVRGGGGPSNVQLDKTIEKGLVSQSNQGILFPPFGP